jgi:hypothetical protein
MRQVSANTIIATWEQVHANYVRAAQGVPDERYGVKDDGSPSTVNRLLETSGYGHYREHIEHIQAWRRREGL